MLIGKYWQRDKNNQLVQSICAFKDVVNKKLKKLLFPGFS